MKLAEALSRRASLTEKIQQLKTRLKDCVKIQEGDSPTETPEDVIQELDDTLSELRDLIYRINLTNTRTMVDGQSLTYLLAKRDMQAMKARTLSEGLNQLTEREDRYNRNEIKYVRTVDVREFRKLYDKSASKLRELDLKIQSIGWITDLIEELEVV